MNDDFKSDVANVSGWICKRHAYPRERSEDPLERKAAQILKHLKARRGKPRVAGSSKPSDRQLSQAEEAHLQQELSAAFAVAMKALTGETLADIKHDGEALLVRKAQELAGATCLQSLEAEGLPSGLAQGPATWKAWYLAEPAFWSELQFDSADDEENDRMYFKAMKLYMLHVRGALDDAQRPS